MLSLTLLFEDAWEEGHSVPGCQNKEVQRDELFPVLQKSLSISCGFHHRKQLFHGKQTPKRLQETGCELMAWVYIATQEYSRMVKVLRATE